MPAAPSASLALGAVCGMQSNSGHCSEFQVSEVGKLRSALAKPGSLGPLMDLLQVSADAACGAASAHSDASPNIHTAWAARDPMPLSPVIAAAYRTIAGVAL